jgi:hypothetical protein
MLCLLEHEKANMIDPDVTPELAMVDRERRLDFEHELFN